MSSSTGAGIFASLDGGGHETTTLWPLRDDVFAPNVAAIRPHNEIRWDYEDSTVEPTFEAEEEDTPEEYEFNDYTGTKDVYYFDEEDHAEESAFHAAIAEEEDFAEEDHSDEFHDPEVLAEMLDAQGLESTEDSPTLFDETPSDELSYEEFGGFEHKHLGDRASGSEQTTIGYGSPPRRLSFGEVVALAGDYFATYSDLDGLSHTAKDRQELAWARWDCLGLRSECVPEPPAKDEQKKRVRNRYFGLASRNVSHFSAGGTARITYLDGHWKALADAFEAGQTGSDTIWRRALTKEAFADHFLTDAFSAGHIRTPRAAIRQWYDTHMPSSNDALVKYLARFMFDRLDERQQLPPFPWWVGEVQRWIWSGELLEGEIRKAGGEAAKFFSLGDIISLALHNYDNKGLDVVSDIGPDGRTVAGGYRWRALGDGHLGVRRATKRPCPDDCDCGAQTRHGKPDKTCAKECACKPAPGNPNCAPTYSAASAETTAMATSAVIASLRDLERVRGAGRKLGNRALTSPQKVEEIKKIIGAGNSSALAYLPREDHSSRRNVLLSSSSSQRRSPLEWRWGQLGDVAFQAVDEAVKCQIAEELGSLICSIPDPATKDVLGIVEFRIFGARSAFRTFLRHLREDGVKAIELAIGKAAR